MKRSNHEKGNLVDATSSCQTSQNACFNTVVRPNSDMIESSQQAEVECQLRRPMSSVLKQDLLARDCALRHLCFLEQQGTTHPMYVPVRVAVSPMRTIEDELQLCTKGGCSVPDKNMFPKTFWRSKPRTLWQFRASQHDSRR